MDKARNLLPEDPAQALQRMIKISRTLLEFSERETQALVQNDMITFSILQDEKELLVEQYIRASEEFRNRIDDFRTIDSALLDRLNAVQNKLGEISASNNAIVIKIRQRAETNTQKTLISAQELGQKKPLRYAETATQQERL